MSRWLMDPFPHPVCPTCGSNDPGLRNQYDEEGRFIKSCPDTFHHTETYHPANPQPPESEGS